MKKKKVALIVSELLPMPAVRGGAIETLLTNTLELNNEDSGIEFTVFSLYTEDSIKAIQSYPYKNVIFKGINDREAIGNLKYFFYRLIRKLFGKWILFLNEYYYRIYKLLNEETYDMVIFEGGDYELGDRMSKKMNGTKFAIHLHHHYKPSRCVSEIYDYVISTSKFISCEYERLCSKKIMAYEVYNGIDLNKFRNVFSEEHKNEIMEKYSISQEDFVVIYVGRIIPEKGVLELVKAIAGLQDNKIKLLLVGEMTSKERVISNYQKEIIKMQRLCPGKIICTGYVSNEKVSECQSISAVQCIPSVLEEAAGLVVIEAMAMGLPTIVTRSGGMVEYVTEQTSLIIEKDDKLVESLQQSILYLKENKEKLYEMSLKGKERATKFTRENYYREYVKVINKILEK